jgi:hypothetical protein
MQHRSLVRFTALFLLAGTSAQAQDIIDGGKYSMSYPVGTARSIGFGNALGSVGGDFSSLSVNPAGIAVYRSSEFTFTPGFRFSGANANYSNGGSQTDNNMRFGINNIGLVFTNAAEGNDYKRSGWKSVSFGMGITRTADFSRIYHYKGDNNTSAFGQYFEADALKYPGSTTNDPGTPAYMGYQTYLLREDLTSLVPYQKGITQFNDVQEKGGMTELDFSLGGNYEEKLLVGATIGIPFLNHKVSKRYTEQTIDPAVSDSFDNLNYRENFKTTGAGVNIKLGAIYKFNDYFRAGIAFHTPTLMGLTETSDNSLVVQSEVFGEQRSDAPQNEYQYQVITPFKTVLSATALLGKNGFVSVDYEYVNYKGMRYYMDDKDLQRSYNNNIKNLFGSASNLRAGLELRFENFMVRGGFGYYGSPYKDVEYQSSRTDVSAGIGYRFEGFFVDLAVINSHYSTKEQPYVLPQGYSQPGFASISNNLTTGVFTIGAKF